MKNIRSGDLDELFTRLARSKFRSGFKLKGPELAYLSDKGLTVIMEHAGDFIEKRLASSNPPNDGKQTPMRNHPVFIAQHATGTCCRKCLSKWHGIPVQDHALTVEEKDYVLRVLERWMLDYL